MIWNTFTHFLNRLNISGFSVKKHSGNEIYLTFDDGPNRKTETLFHFLDQHHISATHFWIFNKENDEHFKNKSSLQRIGIHGFNHVRYWRLNANETETEIQNCVLKANNLDLTFDRYFRAPYGSGNQFIGAICKKYSLENIYWSHILDDYKSDFDPASVRKILKGIKPGSIIVLHDKEEYFSRVCQTVRNIQDIAHEQNLKLTCLPF